MSSAFASRRSAASTATLLVAVLAWGAAACRGASGLVLTQQVEARHRAADLRVQFNKAADAANQAVMADTDEASAEAARSARQAKQAVKDDVAALQALLKTLEATDSAASLDAFTQKFAEYDTLDEDILDLAVENTNLKAQRLSFGAAKDAFDAFSKALDAASHSAPARDTWHVAALVSQAEASLLQVQVLEARHIAESNDDAMALLEQQMTASDTAARRALEGLKGILPKTAAPALAQADEALEQFATTGAEIVKLSRLNTNVRSLTLSMGKKRTLTAECDAALQTLDETLAKHEFTATR